MTNNSKILDALTAESDQSESSTTTEESRIAVHKTYIKGQQFVMNGMPDELLKNWNPQFSMQANPRMTALESGQHEVVLSFHASAQQREKTIFQIQLDQAGLFTLHNVPAKEKEATLLGTCANVLFPYVAVMVNQLLSQAQLPHLYLNPVDFVAFYQQHKKQQKEKLFQPMEEVIGTLQ